MPPRNRGPADAELLQTGTQGQKHPGIVADDGVRRAPPRDRLAADLDDAGEVLTVEAAGTHEGPAVAVEQQDAIEPVPVDLDQVPHIDTPDLMGSGGGEGTFFSPRRVRWRCGSGMGLFVEGDHLPDRRVAIAIPQGIERHLHAVVPQQRVVVQQLEDLHHHLDGDAGADRGVLPRAGAQPQEPIGLEAALPVVDHMGINRQQRGHAPRAKADLE